MDKKELKYKCDRILRAMVNNQDLESKWWNGHNKAFNQTPQKQFDENPESVYNYLMRCAEGEW